MKNADKIANLLNAHGIEAESEADKGRLNILDGTITLYADAWRPYYIASVERTSTAQDLFTAILACVCWGEGDATELISCTDILYKLKAEIEALNA